MVVGRSSVPARFSLEASSITREKSGGGTAAKPNWNMSGVWVKAMRVV